MASLEYDKWMLSSKNLSYSNANSSKLHVLPYSSPPGETMQIRNLKKEEIGQYAELQNITEYDDPEFRFMTTEEMTKKIFWKPSFTLDGYFVAFDDEQMVAAGNGRFSPGEYEGKKYPGFFDIHVLPDYVDSRAPFLIFQSIVSFLRANEIERISTRTYLSNEWKVKLLERLGFSRMDKGRYGMFMDPSKVPEPEVPDGYVIKNPNIPDDMEIMLETANEGFSTRENYPPFQFEQFSKNMYFTDPECHSGHFIIERLEDGKIIGLVCSHIDRNFNEQRGKKRGASYLLAIIPDERGRGFGKALMQASLRWIAEKEMDEAFIGVNYKNDDAVFLYKSLGYEVKETLQGFEFFL